MKRFLLAAGVAVLLHGLFWALGTRFFPYHPIHPAKPRVVTLTLSAYQAPKETVKKAGVSPVSASPEPVDMTPQQKALKKKLEKKVQREEKQPAKNVVPPTPVPPKAEPAKPPVKNPVKSTRKTEVAKKRPLPRPKNRPVPLKKETQEREKKDVTQIESIDLSAEKFKGAVKTDTVKNTVPPLTSEATVSPREAPTQKTDAGLFEDIPAVDDPLWGAYKSTGPKRPGTASPVVKEAKPDYQKNPVPEYPSRARRRGYEGTVILKVLVDRNGGVAELEIYESSGYRMLDRAALRAVKTWRFIPGRKGKEKIDMWVMIPVRFELN